MKHCIIDFETMGTDTRKSVVIDMSAMVFDWNRFTSETPYTLDDIRQTKKFKLDTKEQVSKYEFTVDKNTINFWQSQDKEVRKKIIPRSDDISLEDFTEQFLQFLRSHGKINYWWSRGNSFDPPILWRLFDTLGKNDFLLKQLPHWTLRDTRTFIDAKFDFEIKKNGFVPVSNPDVWEQKFKEHDSSWDILADVLRLQSIVRAEHDMEQITA